MFYEKINPFISIISIALLLLLCIIPALCYGSISQSSIIIIHIATAFIFLLLLLKQVITNDFFSADRRISAPSFVLLFTVALSSLHSIYFFDTQLELHKIIAYLIIFAAVPVFFCSEKLLRLLAYWIIGSTAAIACIGVARYLPICPFDKLWPQAEFATFVSRDSFNAYVSMGLPIALALLFCGIKIRSKVLLIFLIFIFITPLILNPDKDSWFGLTALILFLFGFLGYEGLLKDKFWLIALFFVLYLWALAFLGDVYKILFEKFTAVFVLNPKDTFNAGYDTTLWGRVLIWKSALRAVFNHPFLGVGLGNFRLAYPAVRDNAIHYFVKYAHQDYLQFAVETGLAGLFSLLWLGFSFFKKVVTNVKFAPDSFLTGLKVGAISACFGMIFRGLYNFTFSIPSNAVLFAVLCGVLAALSSAHGKPKKAGSIKIPKFAYIIGLIVMVCYIAYMGVLFMANENYAKGLLAMDRLLFNKAERYFNKALFYAPHNAEYYARLGELYAHRSRFKKDQRFYQGKSIDLYRKAVSISPYDGNLHIEAAITYARYGRKNEAADNFRKAIALDPNNSLYRTIFARYAVEWGDLDTAEEEYKKALLIKGQ